MATILIVSKTQMKNGVCIGGINESNGELIRIHDEYGANLKSDAPYEIGDRWNMNVKTAWNVRPIPHTEDKETSPINKIENVGTRGIIRYVRDHVFNLGKRITHASIQNTFEGCLKFQGTRNFVNRENIPSFSTQFWITDKDLIHVESYNSHYYMYENIRIKFVGFQTPIEHIPAGTIIRLSLANWWNGDGSGEDRCYLQLSGWYLD
jgi:hypothetical protein